MKKFILFIYLCLITTMIVTQDLTSPNASIDNAIDQLWGQQNDKNFYQSVGVESLGKDNKMIAPVIPPARPRQIPGTEQLIIPIEETDGPLNLAPNDTKAYILYNRATISFRNKQYERARELYRELVRKYPESSYSAYALYVLSLSETDYRRKIRILLTIKERFPDFPYKDMILDRLGDIYYLLDSPEAAEEVLSLSKSPYALYTRALITMDAQKPNKAIHFIRQYLKTKPNNEAAYQAYILYVEALINIKGYKNALIVLEKATELRPWAYDNGALILFNAGKSLYHNKQYQEALYAFSLLRLRFARIAESRIADQYLVALSKKNIVSMITVPWLAKSFETVIKEQPIVELRTSKKPSLEDMLAINNLPKSAVEEPSLDGITFLPPMPIPVPPQSTHSVLVALSEEPETKVELITLTNTVYQEITNLIETFVTNRVFVVETNNITNTITGFVYKTNVLTNIVQTWETNNVVSYEPVVLWRTNYKDINITNLVTNIVDFVVTNEKIELNYLWKTNYNFVNRPRSLTNEIIRYITNRYLERSPNKPPQWKESVSRKKYIEIVPAWKTTYNTLDTNQLVTNVIREIKTNQRLELVPRWADNIRTNDGFQIVDTIITNTRLRIAPRWITNFQVIQTNMRDVVITNTLQTLQTNTTEQIITNLLNVSDDTNIVTITNLREKEISNVINISNNNTNVITNIVYHYATNLINIPYEDTNVSTNLIHQVITNYVNAPFNQTNVVTNVINKIVTNFINNSFYKTNVVTNTSQDVITNIVFQPKGKQIFLTNLQEIVLTNNINAIVYQTNNVTHLRQIILTNYMGGISNKTNVITNLTEIVITNTLPTHTGEKVVTNIVDKVITNYIDQSSNRTNIMTNITDVIITNFVQFTENQNITVTNLQEKIITNLLNTAFQKTNVRTNLIEHVVTNFVVIPRGSDVVNTNIVEQFITNIINRPFNQTNVVTNFIDQIITNVRSLSGGQQVIITNSIDQVLTNMVNTPFNYTNIQTNMLQYLMTNIIHMPQGGAIVATNTQIAVSTNKARQNSKQLQVMTNLVNNVITNTTLMPFGGMLVVTNSTSVQTPSVLTYRLNEKLANFVHMPNGDVKLYTNTILIVETNLVNKPFNKINIYTNYTQQIITNNVNTFGNANITTNIIEMIASNITYIPYGGMNITTNFKQEIVTNGINRALTQMNISKSLIENDSMYTFQKLQTNTIMAKFMPIIETNLFDNEYQITNNIMDFISTSLKSTNIELAPMEKITIDESTIVADEEQIDLIKEPLYTVEIPEDQIKFVSDEILVLENQVAKLTEKSAGIAGKYSFSDKKGFVIRIAQLKDLAVATIVLRDLNNLKIGEEVGVYYRDDLYYIEIRALKSKKRAQEVSHILYENGYTDVQVFEQYEVVEYQDT